jgi:hypothetical protein
MYHKTQKGESYCEDSKKFPLSTSACLIISPPPPPSSRLEGKSGCNARTHRCLLLQRSLAFSALCADALTGSLSRENQDSSAATASASATIETIASFRNTRRSTCLRSRCYDRALAVLFVRRRLRLHHRRIIRTSATMSIEHRRRADHMTLFSLPFRRAFARRSRLEVPPAVRGIRRQAARLSCI